VDVSVLKMFQSSNKQNFADGPQFDNRP
jgi:hypothetical protein